MDLDIYRFCMTAAFIIVLFPFPCHPFEMFLIVAKLRIVSWGDRTFFFNSGAGGQVRRVFQHSQRDEDGNYDHLSASSGSSGKQSPPNESRHSMRKADVDTNGVEASDELVQNVREY